MRLYLVHHGEAVPEGQDPQRPLTARGRVDAQKVARFALERAGASADRILHSEKLRARQTAEAWLDALTGARLMTDARLNPAADALALMDDIARADHGLVLVGHLPFLRELAAYLVCGDTTRPVLIFPSGGVVCLERDAQRSWSIVWIVGPELL